jgi:hypothetical protein
MKTANILPLILSTAGIIPDKLDESLKPLILRPTLYVMIQRAVTLETCRTVWKFLAEQRMGNFWSVSPVLFRRPAKLL